MDPDGGMLGLVDRGPELAAPGRERRIAAIEAPVGGGIVVGVAVHDPDPVYELAQLRRQRLVGSDGVGPDGVSAHGRDDDGPQQWGGGRTVHERDDGKHVVGPTPFRRFYL